MLRIVAYVMQLHIYLIHKDADILVLQSWSYEGQGSKK
jgi:hypothetical protein